MSKRMLEDELVKEIDSQRLMEHARYITSEDRESGSPGEKRAAEYFRKVMTELGLETEIHYVENYISLPVSGSLMLQNGEMLSSCITHSYGASTAPEGLTGFAVSVFSANISAIRRADAREMVSIAKIIESIIRLIRICVA